MENNKLIAYSSKIQKIILLIVWIVLIVLFSFLIVLFDEVRLYLIISAIVILPIFGVVVINILRNNSPIAFEIQDRDSQPQGYLALRLSIGSLSNACVTLLPGPALHISRRRNTR